MVFCFLFFVFVLRILQRLQTWVFSAILTALAEYFCVVKRGGRAQFHLKKYAPEDATRHNNDLVGIRGGLSSVDIVGLGARRLAGSGRDRHDNTAADRLVDKGGTLLAGEHHPDEQAQLNGEIEWDPVEHRVRKVLDERKERKQHPIGEPLLVIVRLRGLQRFDARVGRVQKAEHVAQQASPECKVGHKEREEGAAADEVNRVRPSLLPGLFDHGEFFELLVDPVELDLLPTWFTASVVG